MAGSLGSIFTSGNFPAIASGTSLGLGEIGNLIAGHEASSQQKQLQNEENAITSLTPAQLSAKINSAAQPITTAQTQAIGNTVQGDLASRGLAQAPGIFASEESQALAPLVEQNYQTALQQVMAQLGLPLQYASAIAKFLPSQQNMTPAFQLFLQQLQRLQSSNAGNNNGGTLPLTPPNSSILTPISGGNQGDTGPVSPDLFGGVGDLLGVSA
jgi:hypothetical protein